MKISLRGWILVGGCAAATAAVLAFCTPLLQAQERAPAARSSSGRLTEESLGNLLKAMGLEPVKDKQRYDFKFKAIHNGNEWKLSMSAVLSQNGESIWIMAWLDELPRSASDVPRTALLRLLADNDKLGKGKFFAYIAANRRFVLQRVIPNRQLTTASFRDALQDLGGSVADTYGHWAVEGWKQKPADTASAKPKNGATPPSRSGSTPRRPIRNATRNSSKFRSTPTRR